MLEQFGQQSLLLFPFRVGGSYVGAVSFGTAHRECRWSGDLVDKLHLVSRAIATTLAREQADKAMEWKQNRLAEVERIVDLGTWERALPRPTATGARQRSRAMAGSKQLRRGV